MPPDLSVKFKPPRELKKLSGEMRKANKEAIESAVIQMFNAMRTIISPRWGPRHGKVQKRRGGVTHIGGSVELKEPPTIDTGRMFGATSFDVGAKQGNVGVLSSVSYAEFVEDRNPFLERTADEVNETEVFRYLEVKFR